MLRAAIGDKRETWFSDKGPEGLAAYTRIEEHLHGFGGVVCRSSESRVCAPKTGSGFHPQVVLRLYRETASGLRNNKPAATESDGCTTKLPLSTPPKVQAQMQFVSIADWPSITVGAIGAHVSEGKVLWQRGGWFALRILPPHPG